MDSSVGVNGFSKRFMIRNLGLEEHRLRSQQEFLEKEDSETGTEVSDFLSRYPNWEQNDSAVHSESEGSYEPGSSPVFDESLYTSQLEAELRETSDAIEEMEGKVAIRLMVAEAVLRGIVRAVEVDASEAVEISEAELLKVKQELQEKDSTVIELITTLKTKEEELVKLVEESRRKERHLVTDMLTERERILGKIQESEKYVAKKEKELLKMAEHMVELSLSLSAETKRVNVLEKQITESKEAESRKGRELLAMMEKAEQFRSEKESALELFRREARLKELRLSESLAAKEEAFTKQLEKIRTLETAQEELSEDLNLSMEKELRAKEALAEKESLVSQQQEVIRDLEASEQRLREEVDLRRQKEEELSELITALQAAEQKLKEDVDTRSKRELEMSGALADKERLLHQHLEELNTLGSSQQQLSADLENLTHREQELTQTLQEKEKIVTQHLETIKSLDTSEQLLKNELHLRTQKEEELLRSLLEKENLVEEHVKDNSRLKSVEAELTEKLNTEIEKLQILARTLSVKEREVESLGLVEKELRVEVENHVQKEHSLAAEVLEKDEVISKQRHQIFTLEAGGRGLRKEVEEQRDKVRELLTSRDDTAAALQNLKGTLNLHANKIEEKDRNARILQEEVQLLKSKLRELNSSHASLTGKTVNHKTEVESMWGQLVKKEAALLGSESRCEELILHERRLQEEVASMNSKVLAFQDAAQLAQDQLNEQTWRHETEAAIIMTALNGKAAELILRGNLLEDEVASLRKKMFADENAAELAENQLQEQNWMHQIETDFIFTILEGGVADLERDIKLLGEQSTGSQASSDTFRSQALKSRSLEINNLRRAKLTLETKLSEAHAASETLEQTAERHKEEVETRDLLLQQANRRILQLEENFIKSERLFQDSQREVSEVIEREQHVKKQQQALESELEQGKRSLDCVSLLEQDLRQKVSQLETSAEESEEKALRVELENVVTSSYLESTAQRFQTLVSEITEQSASSTRQMTLLKSEAEAAGVELRKSKDEVVRLRAELSACIRRMESILDSSSNDLAEARTALRTESANAERLKTLVCELEAKLSRKEKEAAQMASTLEEDRWRSEVETSIVMSLAEGSARKLLEALAHAREQLKIKDEAASVLHLELEELSKIWKAHASEKSELKLSLASKTHELNAFRTDFVLQSAMQRDALSQAQAQAEDCLKKIEELRRLNSILLGRLQEEKQRWVQAGEALAEEKWKHQLETDVISTVMSEAVLSIASRIGEMDSGERRGVDTKKTVSSRYAAPEFDQTSRFITGKPGKVKPEVSANKGSFSKLDLLLRENDELHVYIREKEQLLSQKTEEVFKLKRDFYKELEKLKVEWKKEYDSDSPLESPDYKLPSKLRHHHQHQAMPGQEVKQNGNHPKFEKAVTDEGKRHSDATALWDAEKSSLQSSLSQREEEMKELLSRFSREKEAYVKETTEKLEMARADYESRVSEMRALWEVERITLLESLTQKEHQIKELNSHDQLNEEILKLGKIVAKIESVAADQSRKQCEMRVLLDDEKSILQESLSQMRSSWDVVKTTLLESLFEIRFSWDAEKFTLEESLSARDDKIKELLSELATERESKKEANSSKLEEVQAEHERKISDMRAAWDAEKSALQKSLLEMRASWDAQKSAFLESLFEMRFSCDAEKLMLQESLSEREDETKELLTKLSSQREAQEQETSAKVREVTAEHDRKVSDLRAVWNAERSALQESVSKMRSSCEAQKTTFLGSILDMTFSLDAEKFILQELLSEKDDEIKELSAKLSAQSEAHAKVEEVVAEYDRKVADMRTEWETEKSALQVSLSERDDQLKELLTKLSTQSEAQKKEASAKLEEVVAGNERKVSDLRALWDAEKSAVDEIIKNLVVELNQAVEKEREALARQASLQEELSASRNERCRLEAVHEEEMERSAAVYRSELDVKTRKLIQAVKDAEKRSEHVRELNEEVRKVKDEGSVLRTELSSVRKQMQIEFAKVDETLFASFQQLEKSIAQRTKQYNLRLQRAHSLLSHLVRQCKVLASNEAEHMQNLHNLQKAEAEVDLLGDEVDALMDVLEKVYTVVRHYHPVIQHYPGLADLAGAVRNELLQRLRNPDNV